MRDYNSYYDRNGFGGEEGEKPADSEQGFAREPRYTYCRSSPYGSYNSYIRESSRAAADDETYSVPSHIVSARINSKEKKHKNRGRMVRSMLGVTSVAALMLGSGVAGAALTERRMSAALDALEQRQAHTSAIVDEVAATVQSSLITPVGEFNPRREALELSELFAGANPAVVAISTQTQGMNVFGRPVTRPSAGSGFLVSEDGYIVTNYHVIENASSVSVLLHDGNSYPAVLVGGDFHSDLAVLKIEAQGLSYLSFADSDALLVGEQVAAIGNPLGEFANSMSVGVVSALDREISIDRVPRTMLQTDAAINRGNSGGPLVDMTGRVVGVVTAKSGGMDVEGLGFAIPSNVARRVTDNLISYGSVRRAVMGVQITMTELDGEPRVLVDSLTGGGGAQRAGVQSGDIIISLNERSVSSFEGLRAILDTFSPGEVISMQVMRDGETVSFSITLDEFRQH
ncbi:MAG: trypsin-like peptidase domain-containing protein [Defluviitaleaceae bacterium]|nr:trypsin-like peptidase domain-containing protein [Defluviitaleaceae bacterium]